MHTEINPADVARWEERRELLRIANQRIVDMAAQGRKIDPMTLQSARDFVRFNPPLGRPLGTGEPAGKPPANVRCCANCKHWHVREYIHCQCSGPWGGDRQGDPRCTFTPATRSQMLARHGYKRRPTWRSLPSDE